MLARTSTMRTIEREAIWTAWRQPANGADLRFGAGPVALAWCQLPHRRRTRRQACSSVTSGSRLRLALWDTAKLFPETGRGGGSRVGSKSRRGFRWTVRDRAVGGRPDRLELCHTIHKRTGYWYAVSPTVAGAFKEPGIDFKTSDGSNGMTHLGVSALACGAFTAIRRAPRMAHRGEARARVRPHKSTTGFVISCTPRLGTFGFTGRRRLCARSTGRGAAPDRPCSSSGSRTTQTHRRRARLPRAQSRR